MLSHLPGDIVVATGVVPDDGRPIPELVVGPFGIAVIHELRPREIIRPVGSGWEKRTSKGWVPTEYPVDRVNRDAERIRHWLTTGDMDFVVRVYAALVTTDSRIPRSPRVRGHQPRADPRLVRGAAAAANPDRRPARSPARPDPRGHVRAPLTGQGARHRECW